MTKEEFALFNNQTREFNINNAYILAWVSSLIYKDEEEIRKISIDNVFYEFFDVDNTQAMIIGDKDKLILTFRGTEPKKIQDWATDIKVRRQRGAFGTVHRGFLEAYNDVEFKIRNFLENYCEGKTLWIAGHSMGGALSIVAASYLVKRFDINGIYTCGCPRVGNKIFARDYELLLGKRTFRLVNNNDVVTRVPPRIFGYKHVGELKYFDKDGKLHLKDDMGWWSGFWDRAGGKIEDCLDLDLDCVADHSIDEYIKLLKRGN